MFQECDQIVAEVDSSTPFIHQLLEACIGSDYSRLQELPFIESRFFEKCCSIRIIAPHRIGSEKFLLEMLCRWLVPGRMLHLSHYFCSNFTFEQNLLQVQEAHVQIKDDRDLEMIKRHFPAFEQEIQLGLRSKYHADRILELKGLSVDEKTSMIQDRLSSFIHRFPALFDYDIFAMMQQLFAMSKESFRAQHSYRYISRVVITFYAFMKALREKVETETSRRHLYLKLIKTRVKVPFGSRPSLGLCVGLNFVKENEVFDKKHLLEAISQYVSGVKLVDDSFLIKKSKDGTHQVLYIDVEKEQGHDFTSHEMKLLRRLLPHSLHQSIQHLMRPIFMPRNEEEVMKHIVTLSKQLKTTKDLPQIVINFDQQGDRDVSFMAIALRPLLPETKSIDEMLESSQGPVLVSIERLKKVGMIRKRYPKEAVVLRLRLSLKGLIRHDHSLDLLLARKKVSEKLREVFGEFRDYNGGMIEHQMRDFDQLAELLGDISSEKQYLLENFYHAIGPDGLNRCSIQEMKELFSLLLEALVEVSESTEDVASFSKGAFHIHISAQKELLASLEVGSRIHFYLEQGGLCILGKIEP